MIIHAYPLMKESEFRKLGMYYHYLEELFEYALLKYSSIDPRELKNNKFPAKFMQDILIDHPLHHLFYQCTIIDMIHTLPVARNMIPRPTEYTGMMSIQKEELTVAPCLENFGDVSPSCTSLCCRYGRFYISDKLPELKDFEHVHLRCCDGMRWNLYITNPEQFADEYYDKEK